MIKFIVTLLCALLMLSGCQTDDPAETDTDSSLKLYVFDCGTIRLGSLDGFSIADDETDVRDLSVPCYIIEHEKGRLLWDGGLASSTADVDGWQGEGMLTRLDKTFSEQLPAINLDMTSFDYAAYSHMHWDHVGVANEVMGATLITQKRELEATFGDEVTVPGIRPSLFDSLKTAEQIVIDGDYDVFGDGRVRIISAPGHTPGHQVLFIDLASTGPILLSGDLYHFALSRQDKRVPSFNVDRELTLASMDRVEALVRDTGTTMWIEHELALFETLNKAPAFYN